MREVQTSVPLPEVGMKVRGTDDSGEKSTIAFAAENMVFG